MYNGVCTTGAETIPQLHDKENPLENTDVLLPPSPGSSTSVQHGVKKGATGGLKLLLVF